MAPTTSDTPVRSDAYPVVQLDGRGHIGNVELSCGQPIELLKADGQFLPGRYEIAWSPVPVPMFYTWVEIDTGSRFDPDDGPPTAQFATRINASMRFRVGRR